MLIITDKTTGRQFLALWDEKEFLLGAGGFCRSVFPGASQPRFSTVEPHHPFKFTVGSLILSHFSGVRGTIMKLFMVVFPFMAEMVVGLQSTVLATDFLVAWSRISKSLILIVT